MRPRTILYTGKGGVGKPSVGTGTARACAASGNRTLVISTDPAHSLSESLGVELGAEPSPAGANLWGQQVGAQDEMERHWSGVQDWLGELFLERGLDRISAEELTVPPGMDELFSLLRLQAAHESGDWEVIIVDCAPTGETLRLLSFPDVARWWIEKGFPLERQMFAPAPGLRAPLFAQEVLGAEMLDRLADALSAPAELDPAAVLYDSLTQELQVDEHEARLRVALPFASKSDVKLKKIGLELVVAVDGQKRTIMLPDALAGFRPAAARLEGGQLEVTFNGR